MTEKAFVEESGVFVKRKDSKNKYEAGTDPSYKEISERVYIYKVKG